MLGTGQAGDEPAQQGGIIGVGALRHPNWPPWGGHKSRLPAAATLADCPRDVLQRVVDLSDAGDLFLLRQVSRAFNEAVLLRTIRLAPRELPASLGSRLPRLVSLHLGWCSQEIVDRCIGPALVGLPQLRELLGWRAPILPEDGGVKCLQRLGQLTRLGVCEDPAHLPAIAAHCHSLQRLHVHDSWLASALVEAVHAVAATLTELDLDSCYCPQDPPADLRTLNTGHLRTLRVQRNTLDPEQGLFSQETIYGQLAAFTSLTSLDLSRNPSLSDEGIGQLSMLTGLTSLELRAGSGVTGRTLRQLAGLTALRRLGAADALSRAPLGLSCLAAFPALASLDLSYYPQLRQHEAISALAHLTHLRAAGVVGLLGSLGPLTSLRKLELPRSLNSAGQLAHLAGLVRLTLLDLSEPAEQLALGAADLQLFARLTALQALSLRGRLGVDDYSIDEGGFRKLAQLPALKALDLTAVDIESLSSMRDVFGGTALQWLRLGSLPAHQLQDVPVQVSLALQRGQRQSFWSLDREDMLG